MKMQDRYHNPAKVKKTDLPSGYRFLFKKEFVRMRDEKMGLNNNIWAYDEDSELDKGSHFGTNPTLTYCVPISFKVNH